MLYIFYGIALFYVKKTFLCCQIQVAIIIDFLILCHQVFSWSDIPLDCFWNWHSRFY